MADMRLKENKDLLQTVKDRYDVMVEADEDNRREAMIDMKFTNVPGYQWTDNMKEERGNRPCYEFNKIRISCKRIINDMRANRPAGKVRAVEGGDVEIAEINEGLIRNIWNVSDGDTIVDYAGEYQVAAGMGAWRVSTEYSDDTAFNQDIIIEEIQNPFTLYCDPSCRDLMQRDAMDWLLTERISNKEFEARWPKAEKSDFEGIVEFDDDEDIWQDEEYVRIAEYWWKEPVKKEIWQVQGPDGQVRVVDSTSDEGQALAKDPSQGEVLKKREVKTHEIQWCICSGSRILEGPTKWGNTEFPFVVVYGEYVYVDGRPYWWGLPRFARDAQRSYNIARTAISETIAQAPKSFFWSTPKQAEGLTDQWSVMHKKNLPFALYNPDPKAPGPPSRMGGADVPVALMQESQIASDEIKAVTGIYDASLGARSNENSGRAIYARQQQGEIATFNYQDNMAKGIRRTYEILLDLIPTIYDTERELRILGQDGSENYVKVNHVVQDMETGQAIRVNDLSAGKYDVTITVGPNFSTQRQEAAETYGELGRQFPELMGVAGDLVFKSMDLPYADDIAERLKTLLPPQIQQQIDSKQKNIPPEVMQVMAQAEAAMQEVQQYGQLVQAANEELQQDKAEVEKGKAEIKTELANLRAAKAEFDAHVADATAKLVAEDAGLTHKEATLIAKGAELTAKAAQTGQDIAGAETTSLDIGKALDDTLATFMEAVDGALQTMQAKSAEIEAKTDRVPIGGMTRREGGKIVADVQFNDGTTKTVSAVREDEGLRIVPNSGAETGG